MTDEGRPWPLLLRTGFGNVFALGRWDQAGIVLISAAINSGDEDDWDVVQQYAEWLPWEPALAN